MSAGTQCAVNALQGATEIIPITLRGTHCLVIGATVRLQPPRQLFWFAKPYYTLRVQAELRELNAVASRVHKQYKELVSVSAVDLMNESSTLRTLAGQWQRIQCTQQIKSLNEERYWTPFFTAAAVFLFVRVPHCCCSVVVHLISSFLIFILCPWELSALRNKHLHLYTSIYLHRMALSNTQTVK